MNITVLGAGNVGGALAGRLAAAGHRVTVAVRDPGSPKVRAALARWPGLAVAPPDATASTADVLLLAVPFAAAETTLRALGDLTGKVVVDCTNPVGPGLRHGLDSRRSGTEALQAAVPAARLVKAFTVYGYENFVDSSYPGHGAVLPVMPIAGDDPAAKRVVAGLCRDVGFDPLDCGGAGAALHLEHMTLLWIQMARAGGLGPNWVWARLTR